MPRGGARPGAGRKRRAQLPFAAKKQADSVLSKLGTEYKGKHLPSEDELWLTALIGTDIRLRVEALKYLTDRRDGKPNQPHSGPDGGPIPVEHTIKFGNGSDPHKP
jgi:hypothetical protein